MRSAPGHGSPWPSRSAGGGWPRSGRAGAVGAPMISPRFSKICTERIRPTPSVIVCSTQASTTRSMSATAIMAIVRSWRGEKHSTRQTPDSPSATRRPLSVRRVGRVRREGGEVVVEHESMRRSRDCARHRRAHFRRRGSNSDRAGQPGGGDRLALALPGTPHPMRRDQNPFAGQRVETPMRGIAEVDRHAGPSRSTKPAPSDGEQTNTSASSPKATR